MQKAGFLTTRLKLSILMMLLHLQLINIENIEDSDKENVLDLQKYISPRILSQALISLSNVPKVDTKDAESIAKATLVVAHHPCTGKLYFKFSLKICITTDTFTNVSLSN